jgi:hypothetical protein
MAIEIARNLYQELLPLGVPQIKYGVTKFGSFSPLVTD